MCMCMYVVMIATTASQPPTHPNQPNPPQKGGKGGAATGARASTRRHQRDVRLSDVSLVGGSAPVEMEVEEEAAATAAAPAHASAAADAERRRLAARVAELEGKMVTLKRVLMAYQRLTSMCVSLEKGPKEGAASKAGQGRVSTLRCTAVNHVHKKALEFQVRSFWFRLVELCGVDTWEAPSSIRSVADIHVPAQTAAQDELRRGGQLHAGRHLQAPARQEVPPRLHAGRSVRVCVLCVRYASEGTRAPNRVYPSNLLIPFHFLSMPSKQEEVAIETQQCPILLRTILGTLYSSGGKKKE